MSWDPWEPINRVNNSQCRWERKYSEAKVKINGNKNEGLVLESINTQTGHFLKHLIRESDKIFATTKTWVEWSLFSYFIRWIDLFSLPNAPPMS